MPKLLVSVRSAEEAQAALNGGASIIDVKEPSLGSLGQASAATIASVVRQVAGRIPVSVALGDLDSHRDCSGNSFFEGLNYAKWGLARAGPRWQKMLLNAATNHQLFIPSCLPVAVAYADWQPAMAPTPDDVLSFVRNHAWPVLLLDTWKKDGRTLLDWLTYEEIGRLCQMCRRDAIQVALAGSLARDQICALLPLQPDIFAVRGAACSGNDRIATVDSERVRGLVELLKTSQTTFES